MSRFSASPLGKDTLSKRAMRQTVLSVVRQIVLRQFTPMTACRQSMCTLSNGRALLKRYSQAAQSRGAQLDLIVDRPGRYAFDFTDTLHRIVSCQRQTTRMACGEVGLVTLARQVSVNHRIALQLPTLDQCFQAWLLYKLSSSRCGHDVDDSNW